MGHHFREDDRLIQHQADVLAEVQAIRKDVEESTQIVAGMAHMIQTSRNNRIAAASQAGMCDPEIEALIVNAWQASSKPVSLKVLRNLVWIESRCLPWAIYDKGLGLMQIEPESAESVEPGSSKMLFDPETNLRVGLKYLEELVFHNSGDLKKALTAWNWGPTRMREGITTQEFARRVLK